MKSKNQLTLGVVGGLGPEAGFKFCLNINDKIRRKAKCQADIIVQNVPVPIDVQNDIINGKVRPVMLDLLTESVRKLNTVGVDFITIPCNTVHIFIDSLRKASKVPILSIIEECALELEKRKLKRVGMLATSTTVKNNLHKNELRKKGIEVLLPDNKDQETVNKIILKILGNSSTEIDKVDLTNIIDRLKEQGAESIILGCTDLQLFINNGDSLLQLIDTLEILEKSAIEKMINKQ